MFGLSLSKIVFTVVVMIVVWGAFKYYGRLFSGRGDGRSGVRGDRPSLRDKVERAAQEAVRKRMGETGAGRDSSAGAAGPTEDLIRCPRCGAWHAPGAGCDCGQGSGP
jgi:hypothetical protein